jgi:hypothetical protein
VLLACEEAQAVISTASSTSTSMSTKAAVLRGQALFQAQTWRRAAVEYGRVLPLLSSTGDCMPCDARLRCYIHLAQCYLQAGYPEQAHHVYMQVRDTGMQCSRVDGSWPSKATLDFE